MDFGYGCTADSRSLRELLGNVGRGSRVYGLMPLAEPEVARMLVAMGNSRNSHASDALPGSANAAAVAALGPVIDSLASAAGRPPPYNGRAQPVNSVHDDWSANTVAAVLREDHSHLDWGRVVASLDFPDCSLSSALAFQFMVTVVLSCHNAVFPTNELVRKPWSNARAHLDALRHAIAAPADIISFTYGIVDQSRLMQPVAGSAAGVGNPNSAWCSVDLYSVLLRLSQQGGQDADRTASSLLDQAQAVVPELVLLGMARCKVDDGIDVDPSGHDPNPLRARVYNTLLTSAFGNLLAAPTRIAPSPLQQSILHRLWDTSRALAATSLLALVRGIANRAGGDHEQLRTSMEGVARVVALTIALQDFATVLLSAPAPQLAIEVAVYFSIAPDDVQARVSQEPVPAAWQGADGQGGFKLDAWLNTCLSTGVQGAADRFAAACVAFLKRVVASQASVLSAARQRLGANPDGVPAATIAAAAAAAGGSGAAGGAGSLSPTGDPATDHAIQLEHQAQEAAGKDAVVRSDVLMVFFKRLKSASGSLSAATVTAITAVYDACTKVFFNLNAVMDHEIEETANALFQRIYTNQMSVPDFIDLMRRYKNSAESRERDIFQCMVHNLFDEYRYFPKYPDKELRITGVLFGMLIQHQLVSSSTLGIALRYVLEALKKIPNNPANQKMYKFGVFALEQFKSRLPKWPQYCSHIAQIPHLRSQYPAFVAEIDAVLAAQSRGGGSSADGGNAGAGLGAGISLVADDAMASQIIGASSTMASSTAGADGSSSGADGAGSGTTISVTVTTTQPDSASTPSASSAAAPAAPSSTIGGGSNTGSGSGGGGRGGTGEIRSKLAGLGADLTVALAAAAAGQPIPAILPSAAAAAAAAKEAEERAAAAAVSGGSGASDASSTPIPTAAGGAHGAGGGAGTTALDAAGGAAARTVEPPPAGLVDRLTFIINNMTDTNVDGKASEAGSIMRAEYYPWLANYLVTKRVATQPNFQPLYRAFLDRFSSRELEKEVLRTTLDAAKKLLSSEKIKTSTQERSLLKNLGSWLGRITLARSKPLLYRDLNVKELLWDAYESGRLIAVVAFIAKVLEGAQDSPVFRPPNPWTMGMLGALRELYDVSDLKLNLKFEVEVLCKALSIDLKDINPSRALYNRKRPDLRGNPDFNPKAAANPESIPGIPQGRDAAGGMAGASTPAAGAGTGAGQAPGGTPLVPGLLSLITLRSFGSIFHPTPAQAASSGQDTAPEVGEDPGADRDEPNSAKANLRNVLACAVDRAVRELIQPVVERSVTIAIITARELVTKDFALEPDADKMARAAHVLASDLAGSLAVITCQDPLKVQIGAQLRTLLTSYPTVITSLPTQQLAGTAVNAMLQGVVNENLEIACLLIEKAAMERAVRAIDEALAAAYANRRKAAETGGAFIDTAAYTSGSRWPAALPEVLRPRGGATAAGLSERQLRVYETFARGSTSNTEAGAAAAAAAGTGDSRPGGTNTGALVGTAAGPVGAAGSSMAPASAVAAFAAAGGEGNAAAAVAVATSPAAASPGGVLAGSAANAPVVGQALTPGLALQEYNTALDRLTAAIRSTASQLISVNPSATAASVTSMTITSLPTDHELLAALRDIRALGMRVHPGEQREQVCVLQAQKLFKGLLELPAPPATLLDGLAMQAYLAALVVLRDCCRQLRKDLVSYLPLVPEERRYNSDAVVIGLLRAQLLHTPDFDSFLVRTMDGGRNGPGLRFAMLVVSRAIVTEKVVSPGELPSTIEMLLQIAGRAPSGSPSALALTQLLEGIKAVATASAADRARVAAGGAVNAAGGIGGLTGPIVPGTLATLPLGPTNIPTLTGITTPSPSGAATAAAAAQAAALSDGYSEEVRQKVLYLLETWVRICAEAATGQASEKHYSQYLAVLSSQGVLANDASTERFLRVMMDLCVQSCAATAKPYPDDKVVPPSVLGAPNSNVVTSPVPTPKMKLTYTGVDALSKLVVLLLKVADGNAAKITLLQKLMGIFARTLIRDADINGGGSTPELAAGERPPQDARFDQRPYLRLFCNLFRDLHLPMPPPATGVTADEAAVNETIAFNAQVLATFANVFHLVQPVRAPGFAFSWLELVSHRLFMPPLLSVPGQRGWPLVHRLVVDLFRFLYPYLRRGEMNDGMRLFYKGTLRLLLVLLHDFPDFLVDYSWTLLEVIPLTCVQLRNLVLAAAPRAIRLPDPFEKTMVMEALPECSVPPRVLGAPGDALPAMLRNEIDLYLRARASATASMPLPATLAAALRNCLASDPEEAATTLNRYSLRTVNALVLYLTQQAIVRVAAESATAAAEAGRVSGDAVSTSASSGAAADVLRGAVIELDSEGRYILLASIAALLRYPNAHTLFVSRFLLHLFAEPPASPAVGAEVLREQIARVLLERIIVHRPHPWGVLVTLAELIRGSESVGAAAGQNSLWSHPFVHSTPEVKKLFESVARSVLGGTLPAGWTSSAGSAAASGTSTPTSALTGNPE